MSEDMDPDLKKPSWLARVWEQVGTLVLAVAIALGIRAVLVEPYRIPSGSMFPTLLIGDHLFVNKLLYGARIPFSDWHLPAIRDPERGDVVVFQVARDGNAIVPADRNPDLPRDDFIKRLVGLPGDRIEVRAGVLYVNGEAMPRQATGELARKCRFARGAARPLLLHGRQPRPFARQPRLGNRAPGCPEGPSVPDLLVVGRARKLPSVLQSPQLVVGGEALGTGL